MQSSSNREASRLIQSLTRWPATTAWRHTHLPALRQALSRVTYEYLSLLDKESRVLFMNHGFEDMDPEAPRLELSRQDERNRYEIQLYHHVASRVSWAGRDALEVSSGRGGGACYIQRRFGPRSLVGVDLAAAAARFCQQHYQVDGLSFVQGNAEEIHFPDESFDIVLNVEASFYYIHFERFLQEVVRVLRPNGHFLYADMRYGEQLEAWEAQLRETGLELRSVENIASNVLRALDSMRAHRQELIERHIPRILRGSFSQFAGLTGAGLVTGQPRTGERTYRVYVLQKVCT